MLEQVKAFNKLEAERREKLLEEARYKVFLQTDAARELHSKALMNEVMKVCFFRILINFS